MSSNSLPVQDPKAQQKEQKRRVDMFLHELALLILAETPIKSTVKNRANDLRGEILYSLKPEEREPYLKSRDVVLEFARTLANAVDLEQLAYALTYIQDLSRGEVIIVANELLPADV